MWADGRAGGQFSRVGAQLEWTGPMLGPCTCFDQPPLWLYPRPATMHACTLTDLRRHHEV